MHVNFEVQLTPRILRAILADMEGTTAGCGCHQPAAETLGNIEYTIASKVSLTSGIVEPGNPFAVPTLPVPDAAEYFASAPITLPSVAADEQMLAECHEPSSGLPPVPMPPAAVTPPVIPAPPYPSTGVKVDGEGLPWDQRIHVGTKTFRQSDNTWKLRKGIDAAEVERVKAELRACMAAPAPVVTPPLTPAPPTEPQNYSGAQSGGYTPVVPAPPTVPAPPITIISQQDVTEQSIPLAPVAVTPPLLAAPAPTGQITFTDFCTWFTGKMAAKELSRAQLEQCCAENGITSLPMLQNRPDLVPVIHEFLASICMPASSIGGE